MEEQYTKFSANLQHFVSDLHRYAPTTGTKNFLDNFTKLDMVKVVDRFYNYIKPHQESVAGKKEEIFDSPFVVFPGIDLSGFWKELGPGQKAKIWTHIQILFIQSELIRHTPKPVEEPSEKSGMDNFNPYVGVGSSTTDFGVNDIIKTLNSVPEEESAGPGMSSMLKMMGFDKMINIDELKEQLENMNQEDIEQATESIKSMLGGNVDDNTAGLITEMLSNISEELKQGNLSKDDPFGSLTKIADVVSNKLKPKIENENIDMRQLLNSTEQMSANLTDQNGNPMFGGFNPFKLLSGIASGQVSEKDGLAQCNQMLKGMGIDPNQIDPNSMQIDPRMMEQMQRQMGAQQRQTQTKKKYKHRNRRR